VSSFGVLNVMLLTAPRLVYAVAQDGRFPAILGRVHARTGTPIPAIVMLGSISLALLLFAGAEGIDRLLTGVVLIDAVFFALTGLASLVIARKHARSERPIRTPGWPFVPIAFTVAELGVGVGAFLDPNVRSAAYIGVAWMAAGFAIYMIRFRRPT
jgi:APA family basic amino acid/polyamine antiporter